MICLLRDLVRDLVRDLEMSDMLFESMKIPFRKVLEVTNQNINIKDVIRKLDLIIIICGC